MIFQNKLNKFPIYFIINLLNKEFELENNH